MEALATVPTKRGALIEEEVCGHRIGWFPGSRLLFAEGHPDPEGGLGSRDSLSAAYDALNEGLQARGILAPRYKRKERLREGSPQEWDLDRQIYGGTGFAGVRRLDSTVDVRFDEPLDGLAMLKGISQLTVPRIKINAEHEVGSRRVETVYLKGWSGKRVLGRVYDKGVETGEAPRGSWVRPEDQRRFSSETRLPLDAVTETSYIRDSFVRRFETLWQASKGISVMGPVEFCREVTEKQRTGEISGREAVTIVGAAFLSAYGEQDQHRSTISRQRRLMREHGLLLSDNPEDQVQIDLGLVLEEVLDGGHWGIG